MGIKVEKNVIKMTVEMKIVDFLTWSSLILMALFLSCFLSSCILYRHDVEPERDSVTAYTLFKDINIIVDPNEIRYSSKSKGAKLTTVYGIGEVK